MQPIVFLSHSAIDKSLVRELDRALRSVGVRTLLDERDMAIGADIPGWIAEALASSTHLCYVISAASLASSWARDEFSMASMREKEANNGIIILPLLLEYVELPVGVRHRKYADFRERRESARIIDHPEFCRLAQTLGVDELEVLRAREVPSIEDILRLVDAGAELAIALDSVRSVFESVAHHSQSAISAMPKKMRRWGFSENEHHHHTENHHSPEARERDAIRSTFAKNASRLLQVIKFSDLIAKLADYEASVSPNTLECSPQWQAELAAALLKEIGSLRDYLTEIACQQPASYLDSGAMISAISRCAGLLATIRRYEFALLSRRRTD